MGSMVSFVIPGAGYIGGVEDVAEVLRGEGAEVVAGNECQVVVVRRAAAAGRNLREKMSLLGCYLSAVKEYRVTQRSDETRWTS